MLNQAFAFCVVTQLVLRRQSQEAKTFRKRRAGEDNCFCVYGLSPWCNHTENPIQDWDDHPLAGVSRVTERFESERIVIVTRSVSVDLAELRVWSPFDVNRESRHMTFRIRRVSAAQRSIRSDHTQSSSICQHATHTHKKTTTNKTTKQGAVL